MSTRGTLSSLTIGSYRWHLECGWHLYHEIQDQTVRFTLTLFSRDVINAVRVGRMLRVERGKAWGNQIRWWRA